MLHGTYTQSYPQLFLLHGLEAEGHLALKEDLLRL